MKMIEHDNEIEITDISDFDLQKIFECGQCFRWNPELTRLNGTNKFCYIGIAHGRIIRMRQTEKSIFISCSRNDFNSIWKDYFDLDRDYKTIRNKLCIDDFMLRATSFGEGIRILRQDKWESLCSFIISQNNNIPRIKTIIEALCREFGDPVKFENNIFYSFPPASKLAGLDIRDMVPVRCGYRAEYIINSAKMIADGTVDLNALSAGSPESAGVELEKLHGVGSKVANCVILFGLNMLDAFPLDVWMKRALAEYYGPGFDPIVFKPYAGIAQQYIFHYIRNNSTNK